MEFEACSQNAGLHESALMDLINLKASGQRIPMNVHLEVTYRCNEDCVHCYCVVEKGKEREVIKQELTYEEITKVLDDLAEMGGFYLTLSGGEVLVRRDFFEIAEYAKKKGFVIRLFTNGIGLNEERVKRLAAIGPLTVELSIFSDKAEEHDRITRVPGSFVRLMRNVQLLKQYGLRIYLKTSAMNVNMNAIHGVRALGKELGVFAHKFTCEISPRIDGDLDRPLQYQMDEAQLEKYFKEFSDEWAPSALYGVPPKEAAGLKETCGPGTNGCAISPYGDVFPCMAWRVVPIGNVREKSLKEMWHNPPEAVRDLLSIQTHTDLPDCKECEFVAQCKRCHGDNFFQNRGDWKKCHKTALLVAKVTKKIEDEMMSKRQKLLHQGGNDDSEEIAAVSEKTV